MSIEIKLPHLGENIPGGTVLALKIKSGDKVETDQALMEIETDKATLEVPAPEAGTIHKVLVSEKSQVSVGQVIALLIPETQQESSTSPVEKVSNTSAEQLNAPPKIETVKADLALQTKLPPAGTEVLENVFLPNLGEGIKSGKVLSVHVQVGSQIKADDVLFDVETDKATLEVPSPSAGILTSLLVSPGMEVKPGEILCTLKIQKADSIGAPELEKPKTVNEIPSTSSPSPSNAKSAQQVPNKTESLPSPAPSQTPSASPISVSPSIPSGTPVPAAPSVRRFAFEIGIDIRLVPGSGLAGRISLEDVKKYSRELNTGARSIGSGSYTTGSAQVSLPDFSVFGSVRKEPMNKIRQVTSRHMSFCWNTIPQVTHTDKADITEIETLRKRFKSEVEAQGGKLTLTSILLKVLGNLLKQFPQFNASIDPASGQIVYKDYFNVGIAVDTPQGLLVPVIRDVNKKSISQLSNDLTIISEKARNRKTTPSDLSGGCITITNLGGVGGSHFTPIVNWPEVAIIGLARGEWEPVLNKQGEFIPRLRLPICVSYDHRLIDGADAARFTRALCHALEDTLALAREI